MSPAPQAGFALVAAVLSRATGLRADPLGGRQADTEPSGYVRVPPVQGIPGPGSSLRAGIAGARGPYAIGLVLSRGLVRDGKDPCVMLAFSHGFRVSERVSPD